MGGHIWKHLSMGLLEKLPCSSNRRNICAVCSRPAEEGSCWEVNHIIKVSPSCQLSTRSQVQHGLPISLNPACSAEGGFLSLAFQVERDASDLLTNPSRTGNNGRRDRERFPVLGSGALSLLCPLGRPFRAHSKPTQRAGARVSVCSGDHPYVQHPFPLFCAGAGTGRDSQWSPLPGPSLLG